MEEDEIIEEYAIQYRTAFIERNRDGISIYDFTSVHPVYGRWETWDRQVIQNFNDEKRFIDRCIKQYEEFRKENTSETFKYEDFLKDLYIRRDTLKIVHRTARCKYTAPDDIPLIKNKKGMALNFFKEIPELNTEQLNLTKGE